MNNDLISREALKKALGKSTVTIIGYGEAILLDTANELIDTAPAVEPTFGVFKAICCEACEKRPQGETNAEIFKQTFGIYATELWSMKEADFLKWLNAEQD